MCMTQTTTGEFKTPQRMYKVIRTHKYTEYNSYIGPYTRTRLPEAGTWIKAKVEVTCKAKIYYPPGFHVFKLHNDAELYLKWVKSEFYCSRHNNAHRVISVNVQGRYIKGVIFEDLVCYAVQMLQLSK